MKLIFLREETKKYEGPESRYNESDLRSIYFVDAATNNIHKYQQAENPGKHMSLWWYHESPGTGEHETWWMPADVLGNAMMDLIIEQTMPFKQ